jgi:hypothetical protein
MNATRPSVVQASQAAPTPFSTAEADRGAPGYSRVFAGILAKATERRPVTLANRSPVAADAQVGTLVRGARGG